MLEAILSILLLGVSGVTYTLIMLGESMRGLGRDDEVRAFKMGCRAFLFYCMTDSVWYLLVTLADYGFEIPLMVYYVANVLDYVAVATTCYTWFLFSESHFMVKWAENKFLLRLTALPLVVSLSLIATSPMTNLVFTLDENYTSVHGPLYGLVTFIDGSYALAFVAQALNRLRTERSVARRRELRSFSCSAIPPIAAACLAMVFPTSSMLLWGFFGMIFIIYLTLQDSQMYTDVLTKLNNRRRTEEFLETKIADAGSIPVYVFVIDVNKFKDVNDTLGHAKGDWALVAVADAMREVVGGGRSYIARWGGDEFVIATRSPQWDGPNDMQDALNESLARLVAEEGFGMPLTVSVGSVRCDDPSATPAELVKEADQMMYEQKKVAHAQQDAGRSS